MPSNRIWHGKPTTIEEHPHQVSVRLYIFHICGGSIISENYVLTAAHCCIFDKKRVRVSSGSTYWLAFGTVHQVAEIIKHENSSIDDTRSPPKHDIALLKVSEAFKFNEYTKPIALFNYNEESPAGAMATITGWGSVKEGFFNQLTLRLHEAEIPIVDKKSCNLTYLGLIPEGQICASYFGKGGKDSCGGDSGGPLVIKGRLAGIVSYGSDCGSSMFPGVYTEIAYYRKWIDDNAQIK